MVGYFSASDNLRRRSAASRIFDSLEGEAALYGEGAEVGKYPEADLTWLRVIRARDPTSETDRFN